MFEFLKNKAIWEIVYEEGGGDTPHDTFSLSKQHVNIFSSSMFVIETIHNYLRTDKQTLSFLTTP